MTKHSKRWICIADSAHARIVKPKDDVPGYELVAAFDAAEARLPSHALGSDRPPRVQESANTARHAIEPRIDPHRAIKQRFVDLVAEELEKASQRGDFDRLMLVAPAPAMHELRTALSEHVRPKIEAELVKDLTNTPLHELPHHLDAVRRGP